MLWYYGTMAAVVGARDAGSLALASTRRRVDVFCQGCTAARLHGNQWRACLHGDKLLGAGPGHHDLLRCTLVGRAGRRLLDCRGFGL